MAEQPVAREGHRADRYAARFAALAPRGEGMFVPFVVLGDPTPARSLEIAHTLVSAGADALELGIPFSDPVADGPTIQAADLRALEAGVRPRDAWEITTALRAEFAELPMGLLTYANLVEAPGVDRFYADVARAGVDSVLVADVPSLEAAPYAAAAERAGVLPVLIATPSASDAQLRAVASLTRGYTYTLTRVGVTGADDDAHVDRSELLERLAKVGAPPPLLGFGISRPEHVRAAIAAGAAGAISGSAVVQRITDHLDDDETMHAELRTFISAMKAATFEPPEIHGEP
jgi:tryptophan synthase alpha chain